MYLATYLGSKPHIPGKVVPRNVQKPTSQRLCVSGVARAQPMPRHSMGTLCLRVASYPGPAQLLRLQNGNAEATREVWGVLPQKILEFLSFLGRFCGYVSPYCRFELEHFDHAFGTNLRARIVRSL